MTFIPNDKYHLAAPQSEQYWRYEKGPKGVKIQLKTIGHICVLGFWYGELDEHFIAWAPLLK